MSDEIETAEDYQEHHESEAEEGTSRYADYSRGKAEAAGLIVEGDVESATALNGRAQERYTNADANTVEAAVAKGMLDATEELAELGALDETDPSTEPEPEDDEEEANEGNGEGTDEDGGDSDPDDEPVASGGVEVDADEFEDE